MLSKKQREALLVEIHKLIEQSAVESEEALAGEMPLVTILYPPNGGLSDAELATLKLIPKNPILLVALRKVIANAIANPLFHFFTLLDGVRDPENYEEFWPPFQISPYKEGEPEDDFLHDDFYAGYWLWRERRPDPGWKLDNYPQEG